MNDVKFGICEWCVPGNRFDRFKLCKNMGYEGMVVDLNWNESEPSLLDDSTRKKYLELAEKYSISMTTMSVNAICYLGMCVKDKYSQITEAFDALVQAAVKMDIKLLQIPSFGEGIIKDEDGFINTAECLKYLCEITRGTGITVGWESCVDGEDNLRMLEIVNQPHLKLYFDSANPYWLCGGLDAPKILNKIRPHVAEIHLKDVGYIGDSKELEFVSLGTGNTKFGETAKIIKTMNYSGWVHNENSHSEQLLINDLEIMKNLFI